MFTAGDVIAKIHRETSKTKDITGVFLVLLNCLKLVNQKKQRSFLKLMVTSLSVKT
jgi:hypothetical protein